MADRQDRAADMEQAAAVVLPGQDSLLIAVDHRRKLAELDRRLAAGAAIPNYTLVVVFDHSYDTSVLYAAMRNIFQEREAGIPIQEYCIVSAFAMDVGRNYQREATHSSRQEIAIR